jgi:SOS response associated peptidase (SRAP)
MIITEANDFVRKIHDRMPALLTPYQFDPWLSGSAGLELLTPWTQRSLQMWPVSRRVNSSRAPVDDPTLVDEVRAQLLPLLPQERTSAIRVAMSAKCQRVRTVYLAPGFTGSSHASDDRTLFAAYRFIDRLPTPTSPNQPHNNEQQHGADGGSNDCSNNASTKMNTKLGK